MKARHLTHAALALGMFVSSGTVLRAQSITFTFGDNDRQAAREWYRNHSNEPQFHSRRWKGDLDQRLRVGVVLDADLRVIARSAPQDLYGHLAPLPRGMRYLIVGDRLVVVDRQWRIRDVDRFDNGPAIDPYAGRMQVGVALAPDLRRMTRPVTADVHDRLPRTPRYERYVVLGDHVLVIDNAWIVRGVFPLNP